MIPPLDHYSSGHPIIEPDLDATYSIEVAAHLCGITEQMILHYQEQGLLAPSPSIDEDALLLMRRIERLRADYEMNLEGLKHMLALMDQVEQLQTLLRARR